MNLKEIMVAILESIPCLCNAKYFYARVGNDQCTIDSITLDQQAGQIGMVLGIQDSGIAGGRRVSLDIDPGSGHVVVR
ncbi:hypothetical protein GF325_07450 [Candidatus Bathyarchaeota archaeon]|nr:hypothetical protein [Candidatus Bathyarchaeota archaeon]